MRYFLSRRAPEPTRILLVESGGRELSERAIVRLQEVFGSDTPVDVLHCRAAPPAGAARSWRVIDYRDGSSRRRLLGELRSERHPAAAILASDDPTMGPWKWAALALLPAKFLVVNENADFFWLDRGNWSNLTALLRQRSGLGGESAVRTLARLAALPFAFAFLLGYAAWVHTVRGIRLALGLKHRTPPAEFGS